MAVCAHCNERNPDHARFCLACGVALDEPAPAGVETRKTVTVVFTDVTDSTPLGDRLDPESLRRVMGRYFDSMKAVLERHGGMVEKFIGDAIMAVFGIPQVHEDDALRAVRAAAEMREELARLNDELGREWGVRIAVRVGINTGEVVAGEARAGGSLVTGDTVNVAKRLEQAAATGEILIGDLTQRLVRDAALLEPVEALAVKGKREPIPAWRVTAVIPGAAGVARRLETAMVGRDSELRQLFESFERAVRERTCHLYTILGPAGIGKTRLANEFLAGAEERATVLSGHCLPYGEGAALRPITDIVREATADAGALADLIGESEQADLIAERLAGALGVPGAPGTAEETFWAVRKLLETLAHRRPLVVVFDDVQWGDAAFLEFIEHLAAGTRDAPIFVLCLARPELLEERPTWGGGMMNATSTLLEPLSEQESEALMETLGHDVSLAPDARARIAEAAEGNPLYVEQMLAMLAEDGAGGGTIPPTIQALLAARLDHLTTEERTVIEHAAVIGKSFSTSALADLVPPHIAHGVDRHLTSLVRKELIRRQASPAPGEYSYRFRHVLIRDATYDGMPKRMRAEIHERYADCLERSERVLPDRDEAIGHHLEQAFRYREELGPLDERADTLGRRARERLEAAGRRALLRGVGRGAASLLRRATELPDRDESEDIRLLIDLGVALSDAGDPAEAARVLDRAIARAAAAGLERLEALAGVERAVVRIFTEPGVAMRDAVTTAEHALTVFKQPDDSRGLAKAWQLIGYANIVRCRAAASEDAFQRSLALAESAQDSRQSLVARVLLAQAAFLGPTPVPDAIARCLEIGDTRDGQAFAAVVGTIHASLEAMRGNFHEARELYRRSQAILEDLGRTLVLANTHAHSGFVELLAGDAVAAEREFRRGFEALAAMGEQNNRASAAALLAETLARQGRDDEAEELTYVSEKLAVRADVLAQVQWRVTRAMIASRRGAAADALDLAREAVALAADTDYVNLHADALAALADVTSGAGAPAEATELAEKAFELYEAKGNVVAARAMREFLERAAVHA